MHELRATLTNKGNILHETKIKLENMPPTSKHSGDNHNVKYFESVSNIIDEDPGIVAHYISNIVCVVIIYDCTQCVDYNFVDPILPLVYHSPCLVHQ